MGLFDSIMNNSSEMEENNIWNTISDPSHFKEVLQKSEKHPQLIYKHSHRCSVCFVAKGNLEKRSGEILEQADMHFLNVVNNRAASDEVASELDIRHESPQVILLNDGEVFWHASHGDIKPENIIETLEGVSYN